MNLRSALRTLALAVAAAALAAPVGGCGGEDPVPRRPIGRSASLGPRLPEGHPPIGSAGRGPAIGAGTAARESLPDAVVAHLDSGNAAYRDGEYGRALRHYRSAAAADSTVAAAWFGVYMAERALGDSVAADSALRRATDE